MASFISNKTICRVNSSSTDTFPMHHSRCTSGHVDRNNIVWKEAKTVLQTHFHSVSISILPPLFGLQHEFTSTQETSTNFLYISVRAFSFLCCQQTVTEMSFIYSTEAWTLFVCKSWTLTFPEYFYKTESSFKVYCHSSSWIIVKNKWVALLDHFQIVVCVHFHEQNFQI